MIEPTNQAGALLLVLEAAERRTLEVSRPELEIFVRRVAKANVLPPFTPATWRRRLYEALAHLEQTGRISRSSTSYKLTDSGREALKGLLEVDNLREMLDKVAMGTEADGYPADHFLPLLLGGAGESE